MKFFMFIKFHSFKVIVQFPETEVDYYPAENSGRAAICGRWLKN